MDAPSSEDDHDRLSAYASSSSSVASSHYEHSDTESNELPGTPSSHSTISSSAATKAPSLSAAVAEFRRSYDTQCAAPLVPHYAPPRGASQSPVISDRSAKRRSNGAHDTAVAAVVVESEDKRRAQPPALESNSDDRASSVSRSSGPTYRPEDALRYQEDALRQRLAHSPHVQYPTNPAVHGQHLSPSASSQGSPETAHAYAQYMAMQQYHYPPPSIPTPYSLPAQPATGYVAHPDRPPVPDAPDYHRRTVVGYEHLAMELASHDSPVLPIYRKFEYLHHRILLHMQDELCEMEEQLRIADEIIAQMEVSDGQHPSASRRGDAFHGTEMHHRRTALLGRIFLKTEQYGRAMSSYATMRKECQPAHHEDIATYRDWMKKKSSIHEAETRFLQREEDLVLPGREKQAYETTRGDYNHCYARLHRGCDDAEPPFHTDERASGLRAGASPAHGRDRKAHASAHDAHNSESPPRAKTNDVKRTNSSRRRLCDRSERRR